MSFLKWNLLLIRLTSLWIGGLNKPKEPSGFIYYRIRHYKKEELIYLYPILLNLSIKFTSIACNLFEELPAVRTVVLNFSMYKFVKNDVIDEVVW